MSQPCCSASIVWSAFARNEDTYKGQWPAMRPRNDLWERPPERRGLQTCIDVDFICSPNRQPHLIWAEEEISGLPPKSLHVLYRGDLPGTTILGTSERQARRVTAALIKRHILASDSSRAPLRLAFPARLASRWLPGLFPDTEA